jgi:hypothetical protein
LVIGHLLSEAPGVRVTGKKEDANIFLQMEVGSTLYADRRSPLDQAQLCVPQQELVNRR